MDDGGPILLVLHEDDGDWQFLSSEEQTADEIVHIHLSHVLDLDPSAQPLKDLPPGWKAWRHSVGDEWVPSRRLSTSHPSTTRPTQRSAIARPTPVLGRAGEGSAALLGAGRVRERREARRLAESLANRDPRREFLPV